MIYLLLFLEFFKVGLFTVGGGLAALPFLYELAGKYDWFTPEDVTNMIAVSESTPGPIAINMATYAGYQTAGIAGGIFATLGNIMPAFIIVFIVAGLLEQFKKNRHVQAAFYGIRPAVTALISAALISLAKVSVFRWADFTNGAGFGAVFDIRALVIFGAALFLALRFNKHPALYIAAGAVAGIALGSQ